MKVEHDKAHDAAYFKFSSARSERQVKLDNTRIVDYAADGAVVGVEFISPSRGMNLAGVPHAAEIEREARRLGLPIRPVPASRLSGVARSGDRGA
jgi:uncharacterized protein YuzE